MRISTLLIVSGLLMCLLQAVEGSGSLFEQELEEMYLEANCCYGATGECAGYVYCGAGSEEMCNYCNGTLSPS